MALAANLGSGPGNESVMMSLELHKRLVGTQPLAELHYSDRYLRSPLTVLLLRELLGALADYPGGLVASTCFTIATSQLQRNDTQEPRWLYHDWRDATDRRQVFEQIFETLGQFVFDEERHIRNCPTHGSYG